MSILYAFLLFLFFHGLFLSHGSYTLFTGEPCVVYTAEQNKSGHFCDFAYANLTDSSWSFCLVTITVVAVLIRVIV